MAGHAELEGEVLLDFVTDTLAWVDQLRGPEVPAVARVLDIGSGPGVGTCALAAHFPGAQVVAVDSSMAMLERTVERAAARGLAGRVGTHLADLADGLEGLERADLIWASMSLHHVGDEVAALRALRDLLQPAGLIAIVEMARPMRVLPESLGLGRPGLVDRLDRAGEDWFGSMRAGLRESVPSKDLSAMVQAAGLDMVGSRRASVRLDPPLSDDARRLALGHLRRLQTQLGERLDDDDQRTLEVLTDDRDPRGVILRSDLVIEAWRQIVIARRDRRH
jgi:SAM-dependent methyltransferase